MNHQIPEDAIQEILGKLPAKSLSRFKCVSKHWCNMIEDPAFVDAFRIRSYTRSPNLLIRKDVYEEIIDTEGKWKVNEFFLVDLKGNPLPLRIPSYLETLNFPSDSEDSRHHDRKSKQPILQFVEGLACIDNIIWNPTTGRIMDLPPRKLNPNMHITSVNDDTSFVAGTYNWSVSAEYFLGFDFSTKEYKVLSISRSGFCDYGICDRRSRTWWPTVSRVYAEILTLGSNSWRNTNFSLPQELDPNFFIENNYSYKGVIYLIFSNYSQQGFKCSLLAFDLSNEKFQLLTIPLGYYTIDEYHHPCEVGGRFALVEHFSQKIWILQDLGSGKWIQEDLLWPQDLYEYFNKDWYYQSIGRPCDSRHYDLLRFYVEPIGSCPSGDILFIRENCKRDKDSGPIISCVCYNMELKSARVLPELNEFIDFNSDYRRYGTDDVCVMHVESIHPLK